MVLLSSQMPLRSPKGAIVERPFGTSSLYSCCQSANF
jgi:hypothetical protein